jgi:hypothetical protein
MRNPFTSARLGMAAGIIGGLAGLGVAAGAGPLPTFSQLISSSGTPTEGRGPCDEAEHAAQAACAAASVDTGTVGDGQLGDGQHADVSGPCDEAGHTTDDRCAAVTTTTTLPTGDTGPAKVRPAALATTGRVDAAPAGTVDYAFDGTTLTIVAVTPTTGWTVEVEEAAGRELEVTFRNGDRRVEVKVEIEDGTARARVHVGTADERRDDDRSDEKSTTSDHRGAEDRSGGRGSAEHHDDRSGHSEHRN